MIVKTSAATSVQAQAAALVSGAITASAFSTGVRNCYSIIQVAILVKQFPDPLHSEAARQRPLLIELYPLRPTRFETPAL